MGRQQDMVGLCVLVASTLSISACSTQTVLEPNPQPKTSYELMRPMGAPQYAYPAQEQVVYPKPKKQVTPVYPPDLVRPGAPAVTVPAQLVMDQDGRVIGVYSSNAEKSGPSRALFEAAVRKAAMQWSFSPLLYVHVCLENCPDGPYQVTAKPFSLWYVFRFKVVNGKPIVETVKR
jgi:hypothetical protein